MKNNPLYDDTYAEITQHPDNAVLQSLGFRPLFSASQTAKIVIIGQAPGKKAQESGMPWNDASGERLISWLGLNEKTFHNEIIISLLPMDFYYPGKGVSGDLPPRRGFADLWHTRILQQMPSVKLIVLAGQYAQKYYLGKDGPYNLTETVRNYTDYLPKYFPIVHPSPLNFRWLNKNQWFETEVIPALQTRISQILMS